MVIIDIGGMLSRTESGTSGASMTSGMDVIIIHRSNLGSEKL